MITRTPFGDCYCFWAEPHIFTLWPFKLNSLTTTQDSSTLQQAEAPSRPASPGRSAPPGARPGRRPSIRKEPTLALYRVIHTSAYMCVPLYICIYVHKESYSSIYIYIHMSSYVSHDGACPSMQVLRCCHEFQSGSFGSIFDLILLLFSGVFGCGAV